MTAALVCAFLLVGAALPAAVARAGQPGTQGEATPWLAGALQLPNGALENEKARGFTPGGGVQLPAPQPQVQLWDEFSEPRPQMLGNAPVAVQIGGTS
ncbi:MAG TPA: hypothetical protein VGG47_00375 [Acidocella sp.]|jgi:hypothetical protein